MGGRPLPVDLEGLVQPPLVKQARLSVQPVTLAEWSRVCGLGGVKGLSPMGRRQAVACLRFGPFAHLLYDSSLPRDDTPRI
jgi:hypothetical protein